MNIARSNTDNASFFLNFIYRKLTQQFPNGCYQEIPHKEINRLFACWFCYDKKTTKIALNFLQKNGYINIRKNSGNGNFLIRLKEVE